MARENLAGGHSEVEKTQLEVIQKALGTLEKLGSRLLQSYFEATWVRLEATSKLLRNHLARENLTRSHFETTWLAWLALALLGSAWRDSASLNSARPGSHQPAQPVSTRMA